ncbi:MAG: dehydrogenase [Gemmatimonadetes bacterium]|nr:dehydrogenase [Gemmatimonadota bacterium]
MSLWLIGAGPMAQDHAKVLQHLDREFEVIGRGAASAAAFEAATGHSVRRGGLAAALAASPAPQQAVIAVGIEHLADTAAVLIDAGTRRLLVEKPGGLNTTALRALAESAARANADVLIGYNRRFYASTTLARSLIAEDGGATTCAFEFTEWSHVIAPLAANDGVKQAWFLANSTHVVDLSFHLCGFPADWRAWSAGSLDWHRASARFCGAGVTDQGVLFSYHADWEAPGRWGLEVFTRRRRFIFRPMEKLQVMAIGSVRTEAAELDDRLDTAFKPGLHQQMSAFLAGADRLFCTVGEQLQHYAIYDEMAGYERAATS